VRGKKGLSSWEPAPSKLARGSETTEGSTRRLSGLVR